MKKIIVFGAGWNGLTVLKQLEGVVAYFCDNYKKGKYHNIPIISFNEMLSKKYDFQIVLSVNSREMRQQLENSGVDYVDFNTPNIWNAYISKFYSHELDSIEAYDCGKMKRKETWFRDYYCGDENKALVDAFIARDKEKIDEILRNTYDDELVYFDEYYEIRTDMQVINHHMEKHTVDGRIPKLCDFACGFGDFLRYNRIADRYGVELDDRRAKLVNDGGINCKIGTAENSGYENGCFDVVTCMQLLEHVEDPFLVMREINRVLKMGGLLYVSVPDGSQCDCGVHVRWFDKDDLFSIAKVCGFSDIKIISIPYIYNRWKDLLLMIATKS